MDKLVEDLGIQAVHALHSLTMVNGKCIIIGMRKRAEQRFFGTGPFANLA